MDIEKTYDLIRAEIREGSTKHRADRTVTRLREKIEDFRRTGGEKFADWLELLYSGPRKSDHLVSYP